MMSVAIDTDILIYLSKQKKLSEFGTEEERNAYLTSIFGQQAIRAVTALTSLGDSTSTAGDKLKALAELMGESGSAAQITEQQLNTFQGTMAKMRASLENAGITLGSAFIPLLSAAADAVSGMAGPIAERLTPAVSFLVGWLQKLGEFFGKIWEVVSNALMPLWNELCRVANELAREIMGVTNEASNNKELIAVLADVFVKVLKPVLMGVIGVIMMVRDIIHVWNEDWNGIRMTITEFAAFLKATFDFIIDVFNGAIEFISLLMQGDFAGALEFAKNCFGDFGEKLKVLADALISWLSEAFNSFLTWLGEVWNNAWQACLDFLASLPERFVEAIWNILNGIKDALLGFFNWFIGGSFWPEMWNSALNILTNIGGSIVDAVSGFLNSIISGVKDFGGKILEGWGSIWDSVSSIANNTISSVSNAISGFVSGAREKLGDLMDYCSSVVSDVSRKIADAWDSVKSFACKASKAISDAVSGAGKTLSDIGRGISEAVEGFISAVTGGGGAKEEEKSDDWRIRHAATWLEEFQHGGIVTKPTIGLLGEHGPEAVIPLRRGLPLAPQIVFNAPLIMVDGAVDRRTAEYVLREVEKTLRSVIVEASSSGAPETHRRIRFGSRMVV